MTKVMNRRVFGRHVENALKTFYDPVRLRNSPLVDLLGLTGHGGESAPAQLRRVLRDAIESLRPGESVPLTAPEWYGYRILWLRYVQALGWVRVCEEVGLSQASYYRHHRAALDALVAVLWEQRQRERDSTEGAGSAPEPAVSAVAAVSQLAQEAGRHPVDLCAVLQSAQEMLAPIARRKGVSIRLRCPRSSLVVHGDPALLRQIILNLVGDISDWLAGESLELCASPQGREVVLCLRSLDRAKVTEQELATLGSWQLSQGLADAYRGRLFATEDGGRLMICLALPTHQPMSLLVVDDDADTLLLYRRYLQDYALRVARTADEVRSSLADQRPDVILLDLLMPEKDGWDILHDLKAASGTAAIPVIVCSVLSQPELALAMGASTVLQKPVHQEELRHAITSLAQDRDRTGAAR